MARKSAAFEATASITREAVSISLKIDSPVLAAVALVGGAVVTLGAFYLHNRRKTENAIRNSLERRNELGEADPEVANIGEGSIFVELRCRTVQSYQNFMDDFCAGKVGARLEEEFKKIGFAQKLQVSIVTPAVVFQREHKIRPLRDPQEDVKATVEKINVAGKNEEEAGKSDEEEARKRLEERKEIEEDPPKSMEEREERLQEREKGLKEREKRLEEKEERFEGKEKLLEEKAKSLKGKEKLLEEKEKWLEGKEKLLEGKAKWYEAIKNRFEGRENALEETDERFEERMKFQEPSSMKKDTSKFIKEREKRLEGAWKTPGEARKGQEEARKGQEEKRK